ncbi:hypothetical protein LJR044_002516 [Microbacterium foliorum]
MTSDQGEKDTIAERFEAVYGYPPDPIDLENVAEVGIPDLGVFSKIPEDESRSDSTRDA